MAKRTIYAQEWKSENQSVKKEVLKYLFFCNMLTKDASLPLNFYILRVRQAICIAY